MFNIKFLWINVVALALAVAQNAPDMNAMQQDVAGAHLFNAQMWDMPQIRAVQNEPIGPEGNLKVDPISGARSAYYQEQQFAPAPTAGYYQQLQYAPDGRAAQYQEQQFAPQMDMMAKSQIDESKPAFRMDQEPMQAPKQNLMGEMGIMERASDAEENTDMDPNARTKGKGYKKGKGKGKGKGYGRMAENEFEEAEGADEEQPSGYRTKHLKGHGSYDDDHHESHHHVTPVVVVPQPAYPCFSGGYNMYGSNAGHGGYGGFSGYGGGYGGYARQAPTGYTQLGASYQAMNNEQILGASKQSESNVNSRNKEPHNPFQTDAIESQKSSEKEMVGTWTSNLNKPFMGLLTPPPPPPHHYSGLGMTYDSDSP